MLAMVLVLIGAVPAALAPRPPARPALQVAEPAADSAPPAEPDTDPDSAYAADGPSMDAEVMAIPGEGADV
jgi:hypothetical protein